ncbi:MAG TPA: tryptophan synthase subunit beta [Phycisphaerae bacterium]|nr:tryptophan synthase subunit beta [Phycisphaerae bacterium]
MHVDVMPLDDPALGPDAKGRFGAFGGCYVPETLMASVAKLAEVYAAVRRERGFWEELRALLRDYAGRPSPVYFAARLSEQLGGARLYLKREDLNHTGAHKINNTLGQVLLARRLGKSRVIAETGAGQHGVATATAAACCGLQCVVYMGAEDIRRQKLNVFRMELLGARVVAVETGQKTLKDAINAAMRDWMATSDHTHYVIGSVMGPHPYPQMVRDFQSIVGRETKVQMAEATGRLPDCIVACVGGGSNAAGIFAPFISDAGVRLIGVEAAGDGIDHVGRHAATLCAGRPGVLHGMFTYVLQDDDGQTLPVHSVSAGLDYPGVGPEHAHWKETGRVEYTACDDRAALAAFVRLCEVEGIIPALEPAHAVAHALRLAPQMDGDRTIVINLSGRGDKDVVEAGRLLGRDLQ